MNKEIFQYALLFIIMLLAQVLICNHIALFNVAVPVVFIYFILRLPISLSLNWLLTLSFFIGFCVDLFSDTPGLNALACTLLAAVRKPVFYAYVQRDDRTKDMVPCLSTLGGGTYSKYLLSMVAIYCILVFSIEYFNFAVIADIAVMATSSSLLTFLLLLGTDSLIITKREKRL